MTESTDQKVQKNPEVVQKAERRRFTAEYKRRIALEAESCSEPGEIGALLRARGTLLLGPPALASSTSGGIIVTIEKVQHQRQTYRSPGTRSTPSRK